MNAESETVDTPFSDREFETVRKLVKGRAGLDLGEQKRTLVYSRLIRRVRALGLSGFREYLECVESDRNDESRHFINALTTNVTDFFRESHHFDALRSDLCRPLLNRGAQQLRIWSAGCSTGQEPWTIAMTLRSEFERHKQVDARVYATDIDTEVIATADRGVYPIDEIEHIPVPVRRWLQRGTGSNAGTFRIGPDLRPLVKFRQVNLLGDWPIKPGLDAIFCRNVIIYFDEPTRRVVLSRFFNLLKEGGLLFLGHSESLVRSDLAFEKAGRTTYVKKTSS